MKKIKTILICAILFISICLQTGFAESNINNGENILNFSSIGNYKSLYISKRMENKEEIYAIAGNNIDRYRSVLEEKIGFSKIEADRQILLDLGFSEKVIQSMGDVEINKMLMETDHITTNVSYIKVDKDGNRKILTKEECMREIKTMEEKESAKEIAIGDYQLNNHSFNCSDEPKISLLSNSNNNGSNEEIVEDGYMRILTVASNLNSRYSKEKGWYVFTATFEWLKEPKWRIEDVISLYAPGFAWSQNKDDYEFFGSFWHTTMTSYPDYLHETISPESFSIRSTGAYYSFDLPINEQQIGYLSKDILVWMKGKARVSYYDSNYAFNLYSTYTHTVYSLSGNPSISWGTGSLPGANISLSVFQNSEQYGSLCYVNYMPSRNPNYK